MIDIFLAQGSNMDGNKLKYNYVYGGLQQPLSMIFLLLAFIAIPTMLYVKPKVLQRRIKALHGHDVEVKKEKITYEMGNDGKSLVRSEQFEQIFNILR